MPWLAPSRSVYVWAVVEHVLNTTDKGYLVIITLPNKMSLVRSNDSVADASAELCRLDFRRRKLLSVLSALKSSERPPKPHGIHLNHT